MVKYENETDEKNELFKNEELSPSFNDWHPLFRPVSVDFLSVFKRRVKIADDVGQKVIRVVLDKFLSEVFEDVKCGKGESSMSKLYRLSQVNSGNFPKICNKCHYIQEYEPNSHNTCKQCHYNPTVYENGEPNPYLRFGLDQGDFKPVKSIEQEPLDLNPSSYDSLVELLDQLDLDQKCKSDKCSAIGLDGLPGVRIKRLQTDFVKCLSCNEIFKLSDTIKCENHNKDSCLIGWVYGDKTVLLGESHEGSI